LCVELNAKKAQEKELLELVSHSIIIARDFVGVFMTESVLPVYYYDTRKAHAVTLQAI